MNLRRVLWQVWEAALYGLALGLTLTFIFQGSLR